MAVEYRGCHQTVYQEDCEKGDQRDTYLAGEVRFPDGDVYRSHEDADQGQQYGIAGIHRGHASAVKPMVVFGAFHFIRGPHGDILYIIVYENVHLSSLKRRFCDNVPDQSFLTPM